MRLGGRRRRALKDGFFRSLSAARVDALLRALRCRREEVVVLNFHRVSSTPSPYWPALTPEAFESLVSYLVRHCEVVVFSDLVSLPPPSRLRVVLSFDDGFLDFVEQVVPILDRFRIRANQNVIVQSVETGRPPWIVAVMDALAAADVRRVHALEVAGFPHRLEGTDDRAKEKFGTLLANYLKSLPRHEREDAAAGVQALVVDTPPDRLTPMMSLGEIEAIRSVHELGAHSYSHESMALMDDNEFTTELDRCSAFFSSIDGDMKIFAFPNGSYRHEQLNALLARGVEHVLVVDEQASSAVRGVHPRFTLYGSSAPELRLRSMGWQPPRWIGG